MKTDSPKIRSSLFGLLACIVSLACVLGSCAIPSMNEKPGLSSAAIVRVSIGQNAADARTVRPAAPTFTKYVLSFKANGSQAAVADKELTATSTEISLEAGSWTITAKGYAKFNGADAEVESGSTTITAEAGKNITATIQISASMTGADGNLGYTISVPQGISASNYRFYTAKFGETTRSPIDDGLIDTSAAAFSKTGKLITAPGYYVVTAQVETSDSTKAAKTEVVHVYSNMDSNAVFAFTAADFTPVIRISGTLKATNNASPLGTKGWNLSFYTTKSDSGFEIGSAYIAGDTGDWKMSIAPFAAETPLYIKIAGKEAGGNAFTQWLPNPIRVGNASMSSVALTCDLSLITLSGSFNLKVNGGNKSVRSFWIDARTNPNDYYSILAETSVYPTTDSANWTLTIPAFSTDTPIYFVVSGQDSSGNNFAKTFSTPYTVKSSSLPNIPLEISKSSIGGTLSAKINGSELDVKDWYISVYTDQDRMKYLTGCSVPASDGKWSVLIDTPSESTTLYVRLSSPASSSVSVNENLSGSWTVTAAGRSDIDLKLEKTIVTLSGTASIKIDGTTQDPYGYYVYASTSGGSLSSAMVGSDGTWKMSLQPLAASSQVTFALGKNGSTIATTGPYAVFDQDVSNIAFSCDLMTVSGTVSAVIDGSTQNTSGWTVSMYPDSQSSTATGYGYVSSDGSWSFLTNAIHTPTACTFAIQNPSRTVYNKSIPNIASGNATGIALAINATTVQVGGTVSGFASTATIVAVYDKTSMNAAQASTIGATNAVNGKWSLKCDNSGFANKPVYFIVYNPVATTPTYYVCKNPVNIPVAGVTTLELKDSDFELWNP